MSGILHSMQTTDRNCMHIPFPRPSPLDISCYTFQSSQYTLLLLPAEQFNPLTSTAVSPPQPPLHGPRTPHLTILPTSPGRIIRTQNPHSLPPCTLIARTERIPPLLPHPLHLPDFPHRLLELLHPRPIILYIVLLDLLHVVVLLGEVHALGVLPGEVADQAHRGEDEAQGVEDRVAEHDGDDAVELVAEARADIRRRVAVRGDERQPDYKRARDRQDGVFRPHVGDERCFAEHDEEDGRVGRGAPHPVAGDFAVAEDAVVEEEVAAEDVGQDGVVEAVGDPGPEGVHAEEEALLCELVELWVAVEQACRDKLVEDTNGERREEGEEHIVE